MTARTEHTPGPWTADSDGRIVSESALEWSGTLNMTRRAYVASTGGAAFDANARLIASAPALLAALEQVHDFWAGGDAPEELENAIHAAIAQARGSK